MEPRDAFQRPEVIAFCDARMLGAFVSTCRSAKTAARECDAWAAIARRQYERPARADKGAQHAGVQEANNLVVAERIAWLHDL